MSTNRMRSSNDLLWWRVGGSRDHFVDRHAAPIEVWHRFYFSAKVLTSTVQTADRLIPQFFHRQTGKPADDGVRHAGKDALEAESAGKQDAEAHVAELEKIPWPFVRGKGKMGLNKRCCRA